MHVGVIGREAISLRVGTDVLDSVRLILADDEPEEPTAVGQLADACSSLIGDPARDEALDGPLCVNDADRRVLGIDEVAHSIRDQLQDAVDVEHAADAADRLVEGEELARRALGLGSDASRQEPSLKRVGHGGCLLGITADPGEADRVLVAGHTQRDLGAGDSTVEVEIEVRQGRGVDAQPSDAEAHLLGHPLQHAPQLVASLLRGLGLPGIDRLQERRQYEHATGSASGRGGCVRRLHRRKATASAVSANAPRWESDA